MDFGNIPQTDHQQQAMINALMQQIETLKRNGNDDILALITAKLTQEASTSSSAASSSFSTILPSPSSSISSPSQGSNLMSQLPTPLGVYSAATQQQQQPQHSMTNITASTLYHHHQQQQQQSNIINNPLSPPSIIPSPSSAFCIPSGSIGTPSSSSLMSSIPTPLSGAAAAMGQLHQQSEIAELLKSFSFQNILQNVQNFGSLPLGFPLSANSTISTNSINSPAIPNLPVQQLQQQQQLQQHYPSPSSVSALPSSSSSIIPPHHPLHQHLSYLKQEPQDEPQPQSLYLQPSTSSLSSTFPPSSSSTTNNFISNTNTNTDDESLIFDDRQQQDGTPRSSFSGTPGMPPTKRKRKTKPQFDASGKQIVQRIRRRRRNGSIPEEDSVPKGGEKVTPPGCRKQPPLPDNNNDQQPQHMTTPDDPIIHSPPSLRPNQMASQIQGYMGCQQQQQQNDIHPLSRPPPSAAPSTGPPQSYDSPGSFQRSDSLSGDESSSGRCSKRSKLCRVCGDNATGYNFNVITCESCKAFFRRNANRLRGDFKCPYSDDCEINAVSRRFCQKCRLKKCFTVGMKKEWILNEDQLKRRKNSRLNHSMKSSSGARASPPQIPPKRTYSPNLPPSQPRLVQQQQQQFSAQGSKVGQEKQKQVGRNGSAMENPMLNRNGQMKASAAGNAGGGNNRSFSVRSSMDMTSPASINNNNTSTPVSLSMMSPVNNSMSPSSSSQVSTSTPPQMSPKIEASSSSAITTTPLMPIMPIPPMKLLTLNEIIHGYQLHITPQSYPIQSPPNTQTVKVVVQSLKLFSPQMFQYFGCGEFVRVSLPITDYAQLITMCGNNINQTMELQNGDIRLPKEAYDPLKRLIDDYTNRALQHQQQQQQISPSIPHQGFPSSSSTASSCVPTTPTLSSPNFHSGPLAMPTSDGYNPNCNEIRTTTLLTSTVPQYDPLSSVNVGPQPEVDPALLPEKFRHQWFVIDQAINDEFHSEDMKLSPLEMPKIEKPRIILNTAELKELDSIRSAFTCMDEPLNDFKAASYLEKAVHDPSDIMNIMDITIRRIVKTAKKLARFQEISNDGKLVLLKSSMIDMLTIRGVVLLDEKMKNFSTPVLGKETKVSMDMFDKLTDPMQKERFMTFCSAIHPIIRKNQMAVMLVALVVLFDDTRASKLSETDRAIVKHYHEMYYHLLQRYIESVYGEQAIDMIKTVPIALQRLAKTSATSINLFLGRVNTKDVAQLPTEFFKIESGIVPSGLGASTSSSTSAGTSNEYTLSAPCASTTVSSYHSGTSGL